MWCFQNLESQLSRKPNVTSEHPAFLVLVSHVCKHEVFQLGTSRQASSPKPDSTQDTWGWSVSARMEDARANRGTCVTDPWGDTGFWVCPGVQAPLTPFQACFTPEDGGSCGQVRWVSPDLCVSSGMDLTGAAQFPPGSTDVHPKAAVSTDSTCHQCSSFSALPCVHPRHSCPRRLPRPRSPPPPPQPGHS